MRGDWTTQKVSDFATVVGGGTPTTSDPTNFEGDVAWITPKDVSGLEGRYISRGQRNITLQGLKGSGARLLPCGTVLLSTRAPVGLVVIAEAELSTNQGFRSLIPIENNDSLFIYYLLRNARPYLEQHAVGSTFKELPGGVLKNLEFLMPPPDEQRAISSVLGALDDKIALNTAMNETLEATARALFRDWFVDFGPVRAKMEGRVPYLAPDVWALFPDRLDEEEKPEGWSWSVIGSDFNLTMGQSPPGDTYNSDENGVPFFQGSTDFGIRYPQRRKFCTAPTRMARTDDTLVSVRAPVGDINMAWEECCIGRGVAAVRHKLGYRSFTFYALHNLRGHFSQFEHTGTVFGAINKAQFERLPVISPPSNMMEAFDAATSPLDERIRSNNGESYSLSCLRDALLPRLLSGQLGVADVTQISEAA